MKCPYCSKKLVIPVAVHRHAESFGGGLSRFSCNKCNKVVEVGVTVTIRINFARKTEGDSDRSNCLKEIGNQHNKED